MTDAEQKSFIYGEVFKIVDKLSSLRSIGVNKVVHYGDDVGNHKDRKDSISCCEGSGKVCVTYAFRGLFSCFKGTILALKKTPLAIVATKIFIGTKEP